jgi:hypothetical protein
MSEERALYLAEEFLKYHRAHPVEKRLAFDAWADRQRFDPGIKRRLWQQVKSLSRRHRA